VLKVRLVLVLKVRRTLSEMAEASTRVCMDKQHSPSHATHRPRLGAARAPPSSASPGRSPCASGCVLGADAVPVLRPAPKESARTG
jgi:hypothetical protein